jgi:hypothetical protein
MLAVILSATTRAMMSRCRRREADEDPDRLVELVLRESRGRRRRKSNDHRTDAKRSANADARVFMVLLLLFGNL